MKITKTKKRFTVLAAAVALLVGGYLLLAYKNHYLPFANERTYQPGEYIVNMNRTDTEKKASDLLKEDPSQKTENVQTDTPVTPQTDESTGKQQVNVLLTSTGILNSMVDASGFVTNLAESGGTCTYIFTNATSEVKKTTSTLVNPSSTTCVTVKFPVSELPASGVWRVYIQYDSPVATGQSNTKEFTKQ